METVTIHDLFTYVLVISAQRRVRAERRLAELVANNNVVLATTAINF